MRVLKSLESLNARSREEAYFPFSIAFIVCFVTPTFSARLSWVRSWIALWTLILFFIPVPIFSVVKPVKQGVKHKDTAACICHEETRVSMSGICIPHGYQDCTSRGKAPIPLSGELSSTTSSSLLFKFYIATMPASTTPAASAGFPFKTEKPTTVPLIIMISREIILNCFRFIWKTASYIFQSVHLFQIQTLKIIYIRWQHY